MTDRTGQRPAFSGSPFARTERILVYGMVCPGKTTTLARQIGERTGLPWHAVDDLTWEPCWVAMPDQKQRQRIAALDYPRGCRCSD